MLRMFGLARVVHARSHQPTVSRYSAKYLAGQPRVYLMGSENPRRAIALDAVEAQQDGGD